MTTPNILLISQICFYVISLILSLCVIIPIRLHQSEFNGHCLLFSAGIWQESGQILVDWASKVYCYYAIFVGLLSFVASTIQIYRLSLFAYKRIDSTFLSAFVDVITSSIVCLFMLVASVIITYGFIIWCKNMTERFPSCEIAAGMEIDKADSINTTGFYIELGTAQFGIWSSWVCWVGLTVFAMLKMWKYHEIENMRVSMFRERRKLVNKGSLSAVSEVEQTSTGNNLNGT